MNKIIEELYHRSDKLTDYIKEMEDEGINIYDLRNLEDQHTGYLMAIKHLKGLIKGGKHED